MKVTEPGLNKLIDNLNTLICEDSLLTRQERETLVLAVAAIGAMKARVGLKKGDAPTVARREKREKKEAVAQGTEKNSPAEHINLRREYVFPDLDTVIEAAHGLNNFFQGFNSLYKDERADTYSLLLHQDQTSPEDFNRVCNMLSEYGNGKKLSPAREAFLAEHKGCILPTEALQKLTLI